MARHVVSVASSGRPIDIRRFGVIGDGKTDDTAAMATAIASGQPLDIGDLEVRISATLTFNRHSQRVVARGGSFKFDAGPRERLITISANDVLFEGVEFNGNARQVRACLIYCESNAARPRFLACRFTNIHGTHVGGLRTSESNNQYALMISPYGVEGFECADCRFDAIYNDNSGLNGVTPVVGAGYCGGIFFLTEDFAQPDRPQTTPTSGQIRGCVFKDIRTVLATGLSFANQIDLQDADGIRFYGSRVTTTYLHVSIRDCTFRDCAKRAVKGSSATGVRVSNIEVTSTTALQYPMVTAVKVDQNDFQLRKMSVYSPPGAPIVQVIQTHDGQNLHVDGVFADRCLVFWSMAPTSRSVVSKGWRVSNLRCSAIMSVPGSGTGYGISTDTLPHHFEDCLFETVCFQADAGIHAMLAACFVASTPRMEITLRDWKILNGDVKIAGYGFRVENVYHEVDDAEYVGSAVGRAMLEVGQPAATATSGDSVVRDYTADLKKIATGYLSSERPCFTLVYGDHTQVSNFRLWVPETQPIDFFHAQFEGSDYTLRNFEYSGCGSVGINSLTRAKPKSRMIVDDARRIGGISSTVEFLILYQSEDCVVSNVVDYRRTTAPTITIRSGTPAPGRTFAYTLENIWSSTSDANVVSDVQSLARQVNVRRF